MRTILLAAAVLAAGAAAALPAPARAAGDFDNCEGFIDTLPAIIDHAGTWCVRKDLATALTNVIAIDIDAHDVTVDCHGFRITSVAATPGVRTGVAAQFVNRTVVRGCRVSGFEVGILTNGATALVEDNRLENNFIGIQMFGVDDSQPYGGGAMARRNVVVDSYTTGI